MLDPVLRPDDAPSTTSTALRCLLHPSSLAALLILGLNDHLWKGVGPAWLTGKLSDFAGLFYFPFLVLLVAAALLPARMPGPRHRLARSVFCFVGLWFAAAKTIPIVHAMTVGLAEAFLGELQVIFDPSDAIALVMLMPAWFLYRRVASAPASPIARAAQPLILGVALLFTAATQRPYRGSVERLIACEGELYALVANSYEGEYDVDHHQQVYASSDGVTWRTAELPEGVLRHTEPQLALRRGEHEMHLQGTQVRSSQPALSFTISEDRQEFMRASGGLHWQAVDIAPLPTRPTTIVVALQTEGVAVLNDAGVWNRYAVGGATPTATRTSYAESLRRASIFHWYFGVSATLIIWILASLLVWRGHRQEVLPSARLRRDRPTLRMRVQRFFQSARASVAAALAGRGHLLRCTMCLTIPQLLFWGHLNPNVVGPGRELPILPILSIPFIGISILLVGLGWQKFHSTNKPDKGSVLLLASAPGGLIATAMLVLWDLGYVESLCFVVGLSAAAVLLNITVIAARLGSDHA